MNKKEPTIPLLIWQTWHSLYLPPQINACVKKLKKHNPEFEYHLYDDDMCNEFIKNNFSNDVYDAYNDLIPRSYKTDLWRLCILYIYGGIYVDIKLNCINNFKLIELTNKEHYVWDGTYEENDKKYNSIYNGLMVCKKNNKFLLNAINAIVANINKRYYGTSPYIVSGSQLLGKFIIVDNFEIVHSGSNDNGDIKYGKTAISHYDDNDNKHYVDLWRDRKIYRLSKIHIFMPYYGEFPNYFQLYLDSLGRNDDILTVYIVTDIDMKKYNIPDNVIVIPMCINKLRTKISNMITNIFGKTVSNEQIIQKVYKLCDFKIMYPILFDDIIEEYGITKNDYVGWGDCDIIYGKISDFIDLCEEFDIIGGYHGHFTAIKNVTKLKELFREIDGIYEMLIKNESCVVDEIAFRKIVEDNRLKLFYTNRYFTDIVPPCYFELFRKDHMQRNKNFFDVYNSNKNIEYLYYDANTSKLFTIYDDGEKRETLYAHFQKRKMELLITDHKKSYYIGENSFSNINLDEKTSDKIRLHILAIPHTITRDEFSHCAFTGKVKRFPKMLESVGFEVYHYGIETSETDATKNIMIMTKNEWDKLRIESLIYLTPGLTHEEARKKLDNHAEFVGNLGNITTPLYKKFNETLRIKLLENYRSTHTDIVCLPYGNAHEDAIKDLNVVAVETGIGYSNSYRNYRIFESYTWLHYTLGIQNKAPNFYWFVAPYSHDITEFDFNDSVSKPKIGFLGRIGHDKGCHIISDVAKLFPNIEFVLCGQGDPTPYMTKSNIKYKPPICGKERSEYLGNLTAFISPTTYVEPFGASMIEAQLCGTPVITCDYGAMTETVENFKTGLRCHTLADFCYGIQMALNGKFDRKYIRERSVKLYDIYTVAKQYEYILKTILDIHNKNNGWYSPYTYMEILK